MEILASNHSRPQAAQTDQIKDLAKKLEANFIFEMLKVIEIDSGSSEFSGGIGEEQFGSFLLRQRADAIAESGSFGLADYFQRSLGSNE